MSKKLLLFYLLFLSSYSYSQRLLKDIASSDASANINTGYSYTNYAIKGDTLFFLAQDSTSGNDYYGNIYFTDGTEANTKKITNLYRNNQTFSFIILGSCKGNVFYKYLADPYLYVTDGNEITILKSFIGCEILKASAIDNWLYVFIDNYSSNTLELWKTDGTIANTTKVSNISTGICYLQNSGFLNVGSKIYFNVYTVSTGTEPWVTDGTASGTKILKDLAPGSASSTPYFYEKAGDKILFFANDSNGDMKLWKTDGTETGTVMVDNETYFPYEKISYDNRLYFTTNTDRLYKTDGNTVTLVNTDLVISGGIVKSNNLMYYIKQNGKDFELWKSNGSNAGTEKIKTILTSSPYTHPSYIVVRIIAGSTKLYIQLSHYSNSAFENITQHWVSNGTAAGTININTLNPDFSTGSLANQLAVVGDTYYFTAYDPTNGFELWKSDGTNVGTHMVKNINKSKASSDPGQFLALNNDVFFMADDIKHGREIWKTDGTAINTQMLIDNNASYAPDVNYSSFVSGMVAYNDVIIAQITYQLVKFNEHTPPTPFYSHYFINAADPEFIKYNNKIYFKGPDRELGGSELYVTDGNTVDKVKDLSTNYLGANPTNFFISGGLLYFTTENYTKIWKTDGTETGTVLVKAFSAGSIQSKLYEVNGFLMFTYESPDYGLELWKTDGTATGTVLVKDIYQGSGGSYIKNLVVYNNNLFFTAYNGSFYGLYKSDGSAENTQFFSDIVSINVPKLFRNKLFFVAQDFYDSPYYLWETDGISAPVKIKQIANNTMQDPANTLLMNIDNNLLVFDVVHTNAKHELWASDGTITGTKLMRVIRQKVKGEYNINIKEYLHHNNKLYFAADDGMHGKELWVWDFTCPEFMTVTNAISENTDITVDKYIVGSNKINANVKVDYNANKYIALNPGFETKAGSRFTASMNGCINLTQSANTISNTNEPIFKNHATKTDNLPSIVHFLNSPLNAELLTVYLSETDKGNEQNIAWIIDESTDKYILKMRVNEKEYLGYLPK